MYAANTRSYGNDGAKAIAPPPKNRLQLLANVVVRHGQHCQRAGGATVHSHEQGLWIVPSERLKHTQKEKENGESHLVPLPTHAV